MNERHLKIITESKYYIIISKDTNRPYIDDNYSSYMFSNAKDANAFIKALKVGAYINKDSKQYTKEVISLFYALGVEKICIKPSGSDNFVDIPVLREDAKKFYYNGYLNSRIYRLKQTKKKKYLRDMYKAKFIVPILLDKRKSQNYPHMHYVYAKLKKNIEFYVFFSTIAEFEKWNTSQKDEWKPLEMRMGDFKKIRKDSPIIINPLSDQLILTGEQVDDMTLKKGEGKVKSLPKQRNGKSKTHGNKK